MDTAPSNPSAAMIPSNAETRLFDTKSPLLHTHERTVLDPGVEAVSVGHERHCATDAALYVGENELVGQLVHAEDAIDANFPALHAAQVMSLMAPSTGDAVPAGQFVHKPLSCDENVPVWQISTESSSCVMDLMIACDRFAPESSTPRLLNRSVVLSVAISTFTSSICWLERWKHVMNTNKRV